MRKALIVSYNFPPVGGAGVQRPVKFVKYLRETGWEPMVLSVENPSVPVLDHSLLADIPEGVKVFRARTLEPSYAAKSRVSQASGGVKKLLARLAKKVVGQFLLPDLQVLWWPGLTRELIRILWREKPELVFVSAPPFSSFIPVVLVARLFGIPSVLDYRDEWSFSRQTWENSVKGGLATTVDRFLEWLAVSCCRKLVAANTSYVDAIEQSFPKAAMGKGAVITNGYDEEDLADLVPTVREDGRIRITYAGTVWKATSLATFLCGLEMFLEGDPSGRLADRLSVEIFGRVVDDEMASVERLAERYPGVITLHGYAEHRTIMSELAASDLLLLTLSNLPGAEKIITGKAFEYMAAGRHILAIVPPGETAELLRGNYRNLTLIESGRSEEVLQALRDLTESAGKLREAEPEDVSRFTRRNLTAELAKVFDEVAGRHPLLMLPRREGCRQTE
ncbi:hypothetical protein L4X63_17455 [Geomonas sp. Red32]|uniref:hypothetical protein n=1 Tax=Geomonas sp. Red32 TaxID=2912856 RepID=UPI00202D05B0|nr:hypothetical protein [Geomonas sp. Red32]MCM0083374.1 hypothetical protein [Geomonas sp. Red32]